MVPRQTKFGKRSEPAPDRGGKMQSGGGGGTKYPFATVDEWAVAQMATLVLT